MSISQSTRNMRERQKKGETVLAARFYRKHKLTKKAALECAKIAYGFGSTDFVAYRRPLSAMTQGGEWTRLDVLAHLRWMAMYAYSWYGPSFRWPGDPGKVE